MKKGKKMKHELSDINPQKMDSQKWDMLLDLLEHPEKYSETQKDELLGDEEVNELYQLLPFCINRRHLHPFLRLGEIQRLSGLYQLLIEFVHFLIAQKLILLGFGILFGMLQEIEEQIPFLRIHLLRIYVR